MEAPKKIYMPNELLSEEWTRHIEGEDIEYIRTDVFIEKAKKWLYLQLNEVNMKGKDMENFLRDFKKYMEE